MKVDWNNLDTDYVTAKRLKKMCKYFKNKTVHIEYEYNNSLGMHNTRSYTGEYDSFKIISQENIFGYGIDYFQVYFYKKDKCIFEESFNSNAEFVGLGAIRENNSGPYNYFQIKKINTITFIKNKIL